MVERAVLASGCGDDSWEKRLSRGKRLAQEAEAKRRSSRDAQRAMEDTISEQAAELERLREEARTRAPQRRRFFEVGGFPNEDSVSFTAFRELRAHDWCVIEFAW